MLSRHYLLILSYLWMLTVSVFSQNFTLPIIDTEEKKQQLQYLIEAPSGNDDNLQEPEFPVTTPRSNPASRDDLIMKLIQQLTPLLQKPVDDNKQVVETILETINREETSVIEENVSAGLDTITLEEKIQQQHISDKLQQFGYDLFSHVPTTFAPVTDIPVSPNYLIGPGDHVIIQIYGDANVEYNLTVMRGGQLLIPEIGPTSVAGLEFREMKEMLRSIFEKQFIGKNLAVTMGELHTIRVFALGEVTQPGAYNVSSLSTLINALFVSGGIKRTGSLRNIHLKRSGEIITILDLYELLLRGDTTGDSSLQQDDVIFVPTIGATVGIGGEIQRPAIYELGRARTIADLISLAGGLLPTAALTSVQIERILDNEIRTLIDLNLTQEEDLDQPLQSGDSVRIYAIPEKMDKVVLLTGHVRQPGGYQWREGLRVKDILSSAMDLLPNADTRYAILRREILPERRIRLHKVALQEIFADTESSANFRLQPRDEILIFDLAKPRSALLQGILRQIRLQTDFYTPELIVSIQGNVRFPGEYPLEASMKHPKNYYPLETEMRFDDLLVAAGGLLPETDLSYAVVAREVTPEKKLHVFSLDLRNGELIKRENMMRLMPQDRVFIFHKQKDRSQELKPVIQKLKQQVNINGVEKIVKIIGNVRFPGEYPLTCCNMRLYDAIDAAGDLLPETDKKYAIIVRETQPNRKMYFHSVNLQKAFDFRDTKENPLLEARDKLLIFSLKPSRKALLAPGLRRLKKQTGYGELTPIVFIDDSTVYPGEYPYIPGMTVLDLITAAGGLKENAFGVEGEITRYTVSDNQYRIIGHIPVNLFHALDGFSMANIKLKPYDHVTLHPKPQWREKQVVQIEGEVIYPGKYPIKIGEKLSSLIRRAGGLTRDAYPEGAIFIRESVRNKEQKAFDRVIASYDDLLAQIHLTPGVNNDSKFPAAEQKHRIGKFIRELKSRKAVGRVVIDLPGILQGNEVRDVALEDKDKLYIGHEPKEVTVLGEVYYPSSHSYRGELTCQNYVDLSGGLTTLANKKHVYVVQVNGEVISVRYNGWFKFTRDVWVTPGATVYAPLNVDRINRLEKVQALVDVFYKVAISAASISVLNLFN